MFFLRIGRNHTTGNNANLFASDKHPVTIGSGFFSAQIKSDQFLPGVLLAFQKLFASDKIILFGFQWNSKPDACFKRVCLIAELITGEHQSRLNPQQVQRLQSERCNFEFLSGLPDRIPNQLLHRGGGRISHIPAHQCTPFLNK